MALSAFSLVGTVEAKTGQAEAGLKRVDSDLQRLHSRFQKPLANPFRNLNEIGRGIFGQLTGAIVASDILTRFAATLTKGGEAVINFSGRLEQAKLGFTNLIGSADGAAKHLKQLEDLASHSAFSFEDVVQASRRFHAMGIETERVVPLLTDVGNAVAAIGGDSETIDRVSTALTQMSAIGHVTARELALMADTGISGTKILAHELGVTNAEALKMVEAGKVTSDTFINAFQKFSRENFGGAMEKQSRTFQGALTRIKEALLTTAATAFEPFFEKISEIGGRISQEIQGTDLATVIEKLMQGAGEAAGSVSFEVGKSLAQQMKEGWEQGQKFDLDYFIAQAKRIAELSSPFAIGFARGIASEITGKPTQQGGPLTIDAGPGTYEPMLPQTKAQNVIRGIFGQDSDIKKIKETADLVANLNTQLAFLGDESEQAATRQKLLQIGIDDTSDAMAREAMALAGMMDRLNQTFDEQKRRSEEALSRSMSLIDRVGKIPEEIAELQASMRGGLTETEKFDLAIKRLKTLPAAGLISQESLNTVEAFRDQFKALDQATVNLRVDEKVKEIGDSIFQLGGDIENGRSPREELQKWLQELGPQAKLTADQIDQLTDAANRLGNAQFSNRLSRSLASISKDETAKVRRLQAKDEGEPSALAQSLAAIPELKVEPSAFDPLIKLFADAKDGAVNFYQANEMVAKSLQHLKATLGDAKFDQLTQGITKDWFNVNQIEKAQRADEALKHYSDTMAELNGIMAVGIFHTEQDRVSKLLLTDAYKNLTDAQRENLKLRASEADAHLHRLKETEELRDNLQRMADDITGIFDNSGQKLFTEGWKGAFREIGLGFADMLRQMANDLTRSTVLKLLERIAGIQPDPNAKGGGILDVLLQKWGILKKPKVPGAPAGAGTTVGTGPGTVPASVTSALGGGNDACCAGLKDAVNNSADKIVSGQQAQTAQISQQMAANTDRTIDALTPRKQGFLSGLLSTVLSAAAGAAAGAATNKLLNPDGEDSGSGGNTVTVREADTGEVIPGGGPSQSRPRTVGHRALGGPVAAGRMYLVGEEGPELARFGSSGMIYPNNHPLTQTALKGGGSNSSTLPPGRHSHSGHRRSERQALAWPD